MNNNKPELKYLIKINSLKKLFNECLQNNNINCAYNILYKMRSLHGQIICSLNKIINLPKKHLFNISCYASACSIINKTIIDSEMSINQFIRDNNIDISNIENNNDEVLSLDYISSEDSVSSNKEQDLPLFKGLMSKETTLIHNIKKEFKSYSDFTEELPTLILFYRDGCPACEYTKPEWKKITDIIIDNFKNSRKLFNIIEIDLSERSNDNLAKLFNIEYIPTIIVMESCKKDNAKIEKMTGMANREKIYNFLKECYSKFMN